MSKKYLIDHIRDVKFGKENSPSCDVCEFYFSSARVIVKSSEYEESLCLCEDCRLTLELPRDSMAESYFEITKIIERY